MQARPWIASEQTASKYFAEVKRGLAALLPCLYDDQGMERDEGPISIIVAPDAPRGIAGDVFARVANEVLHAGRALIILPLISRLFGAAAYGIWSQIGITILLFAPILSLRLGSALVRFVSGYSSDERTKAVFSSLLATLGIGGAILAVGIPARRALSIAMFARPDLATFALLFLGLLVARSALSIIFAYHHAHSRIRLYTAIQGILAILELLGLLGTAWIMKASFETAMSMLLAINVAAFLALAVDILRRERRVALSSAVLSKFLRYSLPLVPAVALAWVVSAGDRYVIVHYLGLAHSGTYSAAHRVAQVLRLAVQPMLFVLFPLMSRLWDQGKRDQAGKYLSDAMRWFVVLAVPATAGLVAVGALAMHLIAGGSMATSNVLIALLAASEFAVCLSLIYNQVFYLREDTWVQPLLFLGIGGLNLGLNFLWIPQLGIQGAAMATFLSRVVQAAIVVFVARRFIHTTIPWRVIAKAVVASVIVYLVAAFLPVSGLMGLALRILAGVVTYGALAFGLGFVRRDDFAQLKDRRIGRT